MAELFVTSAPRSDLEEHIDAVDHRPRGGGILQQCSDTGMLRWYIPLTNGYWQPVGQVFYIKGHRKPK